MSSRDRPRLPRTPFRLLLLAIVTLGVMVLAVALGSGQKSNAPGSTLPEDRDPILWDTKLHRTKEVLRTDDETLTFIKNGKVIGQLSWTTGNLTYTGSATDLGHSFFNVILKDKVDAYICSLTTKELERRKKSCELRHTD